MYNKILNRYLSDLGKALLELFGHEDKWVYDGAWLNSVSKDSKLHLWTADGAARLSLGGCKTGFEGNILTKLDRRLLWPIVKKLIKQSEERKKIKKDSLKQQKVKEVIKELKDAAKQL